MQGVPVIGAMDSHRLRLVFVDVVGFEIRLVALRKEGWERLVWSPEFEVEPGKVSLQESDVDALGEIVFEPGWTSHLLRR